MKIVVLDGYTLNPGDLSWDGLKTLGQCEIHDRTSKSELAARCDAAAILLSNKTELDAGLIRSLASLRYIGVLATGTNIVDLQAAHARNIPVTNVPAYGTNAVAQATIALLLELSVHVGHHAGTVREGRWSRSPDWCYWDRPLIELHGLTMGIIGFGRIGRAVASIAAAFGMKILATTSNSNSTTSERIIPSLPDGQSGSDEERVRERRPLILDPASSKSDAQSVEFVPLETLLRESDVVSLHCPLMPQTRHIINAGSLALFKPGAFLLNTSRGLLVDEAALADALNAGRIAGAGLDVLSIEPPPPNNPLFTAKNCYITPHLAWATHAARARLMTIAVENVRAFLAGTPQNVVNEA